MVFLKGIDVIFCCNVLIYFDLASKRRVVQHFYSNLVPGGYFFLGHAESLFHVDDTFRLVHLPGNDGLLEAPRIAGGRHTMNEQQRAARGADWQARFDFDCSRPSFSLCSRCCAHPPKRSASKAWSRWFPATARSQRNASAWRTRLFLGTAGRNGSRCRDGAGHRASAFALVWPVHDQTIPRDKWVLDPTAFWRHSLGCALVAQTMAHGIGYPEPEKAYLAA